MDVNSVALFFALMLLGGALFLGVALVLPRSRSAVAEASLLLSATVAVGATAGSLYFSEIADFVPCELCWFQRIFMYPLAVILPMAAYRRDAHVKAYARALALIGLAIALYHAQLQAFPDQGSFCELANPCTSSPIETLGWMTIPHMSALAFAAIVLLTSIPGMKEEPK